MKKIIINKIIFSNVVLPLQQYYYDCNNVEMRTKILRVLISEVDGMIWVPQGIIRSNIFNKFKLKL